MAGYTQPCEVCGTGTDKFIDLYDVSKGPRTLYLCEKHLGRFNEGAEAMLDGMKDEVRRSRTQFCLLCGYPVPDDMSELTERCTYVDETLEDRREVKGWAHNDCIRDAIRRKLQEDEGNEDE